MKKRKKSFAKQFIRYSEPVARLNRQNLELKMEANIDYITRLRDKFGITRVFPLNPVTDSIVPNAWIFPHMSRWFKNCSSKKQKELGFTIRQILVDFDLPKTGAYETWVFDFLLYGDVAFTPEVNYDPHTLEVFQPLTTGERRQYKKDKKALEQRGVLIGEELIFSNYDIAMLRKQFPDLHEASKYVIEQQLVQKNKTRQRPKQKETLELIKNKNAGKQETLRLDSNGRRLVVSRATPGHKRMARSRYKHRMNSSKN